MDATHHIAAILHDLRAPLGGIDAMTELLARTSLDAEQDRLVSALLAASRHLRSVADSVLGVSTAQAPALLLNDHLLAIADAASARARLKGLSFHADIAADLPATTPLGSTGLRRMLENLIDNAIKATEAGNITLTAKATQGTVQITIRDTGAGMTPAQRARLTDAQADSGNAQGGSPRSGLGLSMVRLLVAEAAGRIDCVSIPGQGTAVTVGLPCPGEVSNHPSARTAARPLALVVDDHPANRQILSVMLGQFGYACAEAANGEDALQQLAHIRADVVLLDDILPGLSGLQTLKRIRQTPALANLPVIAVTGRTPDEIGTAYAAAGVNGFLEKPLTADTLARALAVLGLLGRDPSGQAH